MLLAFLPAWSDAEAADFDSLFYGSNDYGDVGLMQTPTARMRPDGEMGVGISTVRPYNQINIFVQTFPWLESTFRYTDVTDRFYSNDPSFSGDQHDKDKSIDLKARLLTEGHYWPAIALGVQDIGGTGLFSGEYLVSSYHYYDFDFSFGLGWGRVGAGGGIPNPFAAVSSHFDQDRTTNSAGTTGIGRLFTGHDIGPFGGVAWNTPVKGLSLKLEYDGNDYQHEALQNNLKQRTHLNPGLTYRGFKGVDLGVGFERGEIVMGRVTIYTDFQSLRGVLKSADPAPALVLPSESPAIVVAPPAEPASVVVTGEAVANKEPPSGIAAVPTSPGASSPVSNGVAGQSADRGVERDDPAKERRSFVDSLKHALRQQGFTLIAVDVSQSDGNVHVWLSQDEYRNPAKAIGRTARVLCATAPSSVSTFTLSFVDQGVENYRATVQRAEFEKAASGQADFQTALDSIHLEEPSKGFGNAEYIDHTYLPKFDWDMGPAVRQSIGGPNGFYYGQLYWKVGGSVALTDHISLSSSAGFNIINNFDQITLQSNSELPHVRSDIVKYLQQGKDGLINLEADYTWSPYPDWYHRLSAGIFEEMYAGVATELLYRPYGRSWAVAFDINRVRQRGYDETFNFLPYTVTTGHVTLYYKPGFYNLLVKLSAGEYLAGDHGATLDISREFDSGVRFGVFATKTDVSAAQFGEGEFDKGAYIVLPLDLFFAHSTRREAGFVFRPLTRDGGQMVYDGPELYSTVKDGQPSDYSRGSAELLN